MQPLPKELLIEASEGQAGAFEKIYRATADYVYSIAFRITCNRADAEEVAQDVFLKVHRRIGEFRFESAFTTWLYRITVNRAISASRKSARRRARQVVFDDAVAVEDPRNATREAIEREGARAQIRSLLEALTPDQRACIVLREMEGMRYDEISGALRLKINTVRSRLKRARETLVSLAGKGRTGP